MVILSQFDQKCTKYVSFPVVFKYEGKENFKKSPNYDGGFRNEFGHDLTQNCITFL